MKTIGLAELSSYSFMYLIVSGTINADSKNSAFNFKSNIFFRTVCLIETIYVVIKECPLGTLSLFLIYPKMFADCKTSRF